MNSTVQMGRIFGQYIKACHKIDHFDWPKQGAWRGSQPQIEISRDLIGCRCHELSTSALICPGHLWKFYQGFFLNKKLCMSRDLNN